MSLVEKWSWIFVQLRMLMYNIHTKEKEGKGGCATHVWQALPVARLQVEAVHAKHHLPPPPNSNNSHHLPTNYASPHLTSPHTGAALDKEKIDWKRVY